MADIDENDVYGTGLNMTDWHALCSLVMRHTRSCGGDLVPPKEIELPPTPAHLAEHRVAKLVHKYRETGDNALLEEAGQALVAERGDWYLVLSKS